MKIQVDEAAVSKIHIGRVARMAFSGQEEEDAVPGVAVGISAIADSGRYAVRIRPETGAALFLGMSVEARVDP